ncbi:MAG: hypothetical protein CMG94_00450 [Marinoscillum sp.]|nr:hypothetical protein [Marinoscillum sp.]OUX27264.1 MAG: hypothetical protein CBE22_00060 [Flammeovirgaceae bacterium TMED262]|tara:strand:+ start:2006 stop:2875 length:870 start_codon:yes stop_codon:yes gene_type:complete
MLKRVDHIFDTIFSIKSQKSFEKYILILATGGFILHLLLIFLNKYGYINFTFNDTLLLDPISALYTPFSFILVYEAYLLIYYLPNSFTVTVVKEYEIISLILIRKIFKDFPLVDLDVPFFSNENNVQLLYDISGILIVFFLIFLFKTTAGRPKTIKPDARLKKFISQKKFISILLVPILLTLAIWSFYSWVDSSILLNGSVQNLNYLFFVDFFTILILVDVFILLISFRYTERYSQLIRNTGFIISTILLRLSFAATGIVSVVLIASGILFGLIILAIFKRMEKVKYLG